MAIAAQAVSVGAALASTAPSTNAAEAMLADMRLFAAHGDEGMQTRLQDAAQQLSSGAASESAQLLQSVLRRRPDSVVALELAAQTAQVKGEHTVACAHLEDLLLLLPDDGRAELMMARSLLALGRLASARLFLQKAQASARRLSDDATRARAAELLATLTPRVTGRLSEQWSGRLARIADEECAAPTTGLEQCTLPASAGVSAAAAPAPPLSPAYPHLLERGRFAAGAHYSGVDLDYSGLQLIHREPNVFLAHDFLSERECERVLALVRPRTPVVRGTAALPNAAAGEQTGALGTEESAHAMLSTSEASQETLMTDTRRLVPLMQAEVPQVVLKLTRLLRCDARQLGELHAVHYRHGDQFAPHYDVPGGAWASEGFEGTSRLATVFIYLNDVPRGGETHFLNLSVRVQPRRGLAVVFFPATVDSLQRDGRLMHASTPAIDEKWTLNAFMWGRLGRRLEFAWGEVD